MLTPKKFLRLFLIVAVSALTVLGLASCSEEEHHEIAEGQSVELGDLEYKVVFSRLLNSRDVEDRNYIGEKGPPEEDHSYLGVFIQIENLSEEDSREVPEEFTVTDTEGSEFEPIETDSVFALELGRELEPQTQAPALDSPAETGPINGSLLLYEIPDEATENRPLELVIPDEEEDVRVELDI